MNSFQEPATGTQPAAEGGPPTSAVRPLSTCDALDNGGGRCGRTAWRTYVDSDGTERGFCWLAQHSFDVVDRYPPAEDARPKPVAP